MRKKERRRRKGRQKKGKTWKGAKNGKWQALSLRRRHFQFTVHNHNVHTCTPYTYAILESEKYKKYKWTFCLLLLRLFVHLALEGLHLVLLDHRQQNTTLKKQEYIFFWGGRGGRGRLFSKCRFKFLSYISNWAVY